MSIVGLERALSAYVKDSSHTAPFDLKTVPLATTPMQDQVVKPGKAGESIHQWKDTVQDKKQHHRKVLLNSFHLNGHTLGFHPQTQKLAPPCTAS